MIAYEVYHHDKPKGDNLIGIFPERRRNPERITEDSVRKWMKEILNDLVDLHRVSFVKITLD